MQVIYRFVPGILTLALCGTAFSHGISADGWNAVAPPNTGTGTSVVLDPTALPAGISLTGISSLSFSVGTTPFNSYGILSTIPQGGGSPEGPPADEYVWGTVSNDPTGNTVTDGIQVALLACAGPGACQYTSSPTLMIAFGYGDTSAGCADEAGEIASVSVNGTTYQAKNPCSLVAGSGDLTFQNGVLEAGTGVGWSVVPLPASFWLMLGGLGGLGALVRKNHSSWNSPILV